MLTALELDIMKAIWSRPGIPVREVQDAIRPGRQLAYTTVMTIMDRLYHKGFLRRSLQARTHYYESAIDYSDVRDEAVEVLIKSFFGSKENLKEFLNGEQMAIPPKTTIPPKIVGESSPRHFDETLL